MFCNCFGGSRRRLIFGGAAALLSATSSGRAQEKWTLGLKGTCSFYPGIDVDADVYTFGSPAEGLEVIQRITSKVGLAPNFSVMQANVPNAAAVIRDGTRYILYSQVFIDRTKSQSTEWATWAILAHEVAHHLNGHTLLESGSRPPLELQADQFAGFAIRRMDGSLEQALAAYQSMPTAGSTTHPPRSARLEAVTRGYHEAGPSGRVEPVVGSAEAILRSAILQIQGGAVPREQMLPGMADGIRAQLPQATPFLNQAGQIQGIRETDKKVQGNQTVHYFRVQFTNTALTWQLGLMANGVISSLYFTP